MTGRSILIIEDDPDIAEVITIILTDDGYRVTAIAETEDIINSVQEIKPDLVITDYILNGINGGEYCSQLKRDPRTLHIPVIILSGYGRVLESLGHYGADQIIHKPFDNEDLSRKVAALLNLSASDSSNE
ncbi:response regulator [Mucilaginibacter sp. PAMB04168]|uniref:response regulator n=1 Tax=Mucilaginibacter sp. PAMB04168 TaxID=3138567 RepID=UPI0031F6FD0A